MRVKIFESHNKKEIEQEFDEFMFNYPQIVVVQILQSSAPSGEESMFDSITTLSVIYYNDSKDNLPTVKN